MTGFLSELRYAARTLLRTPGFTATAVIALALGIGANSAIFSVLDTVLIRPLPYADSDRLVVVWEEMSYVGFARNTPAPANYVDWRKQNRVFSDMAALAYTGASFSGEGGRPEATPGRRVTANLFGILGVNPQIGRFFTEEEDRGGARVVVLTDSIWQRRYGGNKSIVGRDIIMDGANRTVVGILPRGVRFPSGVEEFYVPASFTPQDLARRSSHFLNVVARLKPGITVEEARTEMTGIAKRLEREYPDSNTHLGAVVIPMREQMAGRTGPALTVLLAASTFVLLIACTNIANLMLARGWARRREYAVRCALGASRWALLRPMLAEAFLCSTVGAALGLAFAAAGMKALATAVPQALLATGGISMNARVLGFTCLVAISATLIAGLIPALRAGRTDAAGDLKQGGRTAGDTSAARRVLVIAEVSLALVLLAGAGLMVQSLSRLRARDLGFEPEHVLTLTTPLGGPKYAADDTQRRAFVRDVLDRVRVLPGVQAAGFASNLPFTTIGNTNGFLLEGRPQPPPGSTQDALYREVTIGYLETIQARLKEGRMLERRDTLEATPVVVINETFARTHWPNASPLGQRLTTDWRSPQRKWWTIVGVVRDVRERGYELESKPAMYFADTQVERPDPYTLAVRVAGEPMSIANAVRDAVWAVDREVPIVRVRPMTALVENNVADRRQQMTVLSTFAGLAVLLASIGIYGVLSFLVTQRTKEIGVRMALGATRAGVVSLIARQGGTLVGVGIIIGTCLALVATRALESLLYGVRASDPGTYLAVAAGLGVLGVIASVIPAWRASRIDPIRALRDE